MEAEKKDLDRAGVIEVRGIPITELGGAVTSDERTPLFTCARKSSR